MSPACVLLLQACELGTNPNSSFADSQSADCSQTAPHHSLSCHSLWAAVGFSRPAGGSTNSQAHQQELWPLRPQCQVVDAAQHAARVALWVQAEQQLGVLQSCGVQAPPAQVLRGKVRAFKQLAVLGTQDFRGAACRPRLLRVCSIEGQTFQQLGRLCSRGVAGNCHIFMGTVLSCTAGTSSTTGAWSTDGCSVLTLAP